MTLSFTVQLWMPRKCLLLASSYILFCFCLYFRQGCHMVSNEKSQTIKRKKPGKSQTKFCRKTSIFRRFCCQKIQFWWKSSQIVQQYSDCGKKFCKFWKFLANFGKRLSLFWALLTWLAQFSEFYLISSNVLLVTGELHFFATREQCKITFLKII